MNEFIVPDKITRIEIENGVLHLHQAYDTIHRFERVGFHILKYWDQDRESPSMLNIAIDATGADFLHTQANLAIVDRNTITAHEHEIYLSWQADQIEEMFDE